MAGTTFTWTAVGASSWTVGGNWTPLGPPGALDFAIVSTGDALVTAATVTVADLALGGLLSGPLTGNGTVAVANNAAILVSDAIAVWSGSTLSVDATSFVDIGTAGTAPAGSIAVENGHTLLGDGVVAG